MVDKKQLEKLPRRGLLPGYESGRYEPVRQYDQEEFRKQGFEDPLRRDNRVSIRVSGPDMAELHRLALAEGVPLQSLIANIVHRYVSALTQESGPAVPASPAESPIAPNPTPDR